MRLVILFILSFSSMSCLADWVIEIKEYKNLTQIKVMSYNTVSDQKIFKTPTNVECDEDDCRWKDKNGKTVKMYFDQSFQYIAVVRSE